MAGRALPACGFVVYADKAGALPLSIERRAKGKRVTIIREVKGNARALCHSLTSLLGVGGTVHSKGSVSDVEVQGEQTERVQSALQQLACVRGPNGAKLKAPAVVERSCAYDEFLKEEEGQTLRRKERWDAGPRQVRSEPPEDAPCRAWHGYWIYCNGHCEALDPTIIWDDIQEIRSDPMAGYAPAARPPSAPSQLDAVLQRLGLMAAVGPAVESYRLELAAARAERAQPKASFCAVQPRPESEAQVFTCGTCGASFTMQRTLKMHKRSCAAQMNIASSAAPLGIEPPSWRWDSMSKAREDAEMEFVSDPDPLNPVMNVVNDEFLSPEAAQYLMPESPKYTLGSLLDHAIPLVSRNRQKKATAIPKKDRTGTATRPCPVCDQEYPEAMLPAHVEDCLQATEDLPQGEEFRDAAELPEELLESLLQLQLTPASSEVFWSAFEHWREARGVQEAFLAALEEALRWVPEQDGEEPGFALEEAREDAAEEPQDSVPCPICGLLFPGSSIETHVDGCLSAAPVAPTAPAAPSVAPSERAETKASRWARQTKAAPAVAAGWEEEPMVKEGAKLETAQERISRMKREAKERKAGSSRMVT
ncbi:unnamed protein product [Durusdinium trenchii]|uniref:Uncharacterized protein n=1 Tax=Durusdinium trenchii TaxID=1381693 RepID=A0ABP0QW92_9DINO